MQRFGNIFAIVVILLVAVASCAQEEYPLALWIAQHPSPEAGTTLAGPPGVAICTQARAQSLPARLIAMSGSAAPSSNVIFASTLFTEYFVPACGPCHGPAVDPPGQGGFQISTAAEFPSLMTATVIAHVTGAVCPTAPEPGVATDPMPPCSSPDGQTYSERPETDIVKQFAELVLQWLQAGSPPSFTPSDGDAGVATASDAGSSSSAYTMAPANGNAMTNIGNCVPSTAMIGTQPTQMAMMDAMFASLQAQPGGTPAQALGLPEHLGQTDLFTFDSAALAANRVIAYAPGYPLWSDNAGKLRFVRVPVGQSIHFNSATQQFEIPPNTRFYKTFMKQIVDTDGSYRYRKIETRVIVSRPDQNNSDGTVTQTALFGSYLWNDDETDAVLVETPLNDGEPFADTLLLYNTNEPLAADVLQSQPADPEEQLVEYGAARHYAIPSSQRCMQCHMGSPSESFVLGFTPLQINRMPTGTHGVIEEAGPDELTQLQRFIDAGIVTGLDSASDAPLLEQSQGARTPRNYYEVTAQGYVLGNCAHCHNPRGYPTQQNPLLLNVLDFLPTAGPVGGLFQFPLESYSPSIFRGVSGSTPIPFITPSLVDLPKYNPQGGGQVGDWFVDSAGSGSVYWVNYAPWRAIIYRNVDNAFAYTDDEALFPHMPMNALGYDPRAKQILSDWMVSIPSVRKHPEIVEYAYQVDTNVGDNINSSVVDTTPQPYVEVLPGDPRYDAAVAAAEQRLEILHTGVNPAVPTLGPGYSRYADPGQTADTLDPQVTADPICHPIPVGDAVLYDTPVPVHPQWVVTDLTQPPGPWTPRRADWANVLVEQQIPPPSTTCSSSAAATSAYDDQVDAVRLLQSATLEQVEPYITTPVPFGLWEALPGCDFSQQPTVQSFKGDTRPHWMDVTNPPPDAPVYEESPGAAVFKMICINCHGPLGDANGRMAQNLATMTGGLARVADFRDGLFGPVGSTPANDNRHLVFGSAELPSNAPSNWTSITDDDRAARYMPWMALGGTEVTIPQPILAIVAVTQVLNEQRVLVSSNLSANMLSEAKALCLSLLGPSYNQVSAASFNPTPGHAYMDAGIDSLNTSLIWSNGDAELWLQLCSLANPSPVHVLAVNARGIEVPSYQDENYNVALELNGGAWVPSTSYPPSAPVGNQQGGVDATLLATNEWPWCLDLTAASSVQVEYYASINAPVCPSSVVTLSHACATNTGPNCFASPSANQWAVRGAINAGMAVFMYVSSVLEPSGPAPDYNQCNLLP
ncbi:MAG TPA: hypothetical protein VEK07_24930 [Polyangiaceae bacterium]|nr:hypothetical protein [Polyangiaceae bacterium]